MYEEEVVVVPCLQRRRSLGGWLYGFAFALFVRPKREPNERQGTAERGRSPSSADPLACVKYLSAPNQHQHE